MKKRRVGAASRNPEIAIIKQWFLSFDEKINNENTHWTRRPNSGGDCNWSRARASQNLRRTWRSSAGRWNRSVDRDWTRTHGRDWWLCLIRTKSINQSINQSRNRAIKQSSKQASNQPINQSINQSIDQAIEQSSNQAINQSIEEAR